MPFVITDPCIGTKDTPASTFVRLTASTHVKMSRSSRARRCSSSIPTNRIDCGACVPACPVSAIYDSVDSTPQSQKSLIDANSVYRGGEASAVAEAVALVQGHIDSHPDLMAIDPKDRQAAH